MAKIENRDIFGPDVISKTTEDVKLLLKALDDLEKGFVDVAKAQQKIVNSEDQKTIQSVQKTRDAVKQLNDVEKASSKVKAERKRLSDSLNKTLSKENDTIIELQASLDQLKRKRTQLNKDEKKGLITAKEANRQRAETNLLIKATTKNLNASQKAVLDNSNQVKKSTGSFQALNVQVNRSNKLLTNIGSTLKSGFSAIGLTLGITALAGAFRNTFNRIREFDKVMQNISGVTGTARRDLKSLEKTIISVSSTSTKTANEVAKLASTLFTLGNSERDVKLLLKPVNDLSIALGTTSEEAADFLGQTLNAFGKGASSGQEFADIIANVKTSTSLDFQRIKDALGFVAPTANSLGLSLGQVSAQVGVLQDNGIKAARAGRLLNTSFARLIEKGLTLDQALVKINESQNKVSTATNLFGKESFTLGLILADNVDRTAELANEFDNLSEGSLKTLTDEQLKSMDAQLKILDSTWEKFILSLDSGNSVIGDLTRNLTGFLADTITGFQNLDLIAKSTFRGLIDFRDEELSRTLDGGWITETGVNINKIRQEFDKIPLDKIAKNVDKVRESWIDILGEDRTDAALLFTQYIRERTDAEKELSVETNINTVATEGNSKAKSINAKTTRELTGLIELQAKVVKDLNTQVQRAETEEDILSLGIKADVAKEELERLKRIVSSSFEEIDKIERDLVEDATERRIQQELAKSDKLIDTIESNSRIGEDKKKELIAAENERLADFVNNEELKSAQQRIKNETEFSKAEFEQRRTGFETQKKFEEEKAEQFKAIRINAIEDEIKALEQFGGDAGELRIAQLNAELEGLRGIGEGFEKLKFDIGDIVGVIGELIDEAFDKRIEAIGEKLNKTGENINRLRGKAQEGRLESEESLAFEQKQEIELARQKETEQKRQEKTKALFAILSSFNANDGNLPKTIADISVLKALASGLTAFDGVDDTGSRGNIDSKGGKLWTLHPNEQVWSKKDRGDVGFRNRDEIKDIVGMYDNGFMMDALNHDSADFMNKSSFVLNGMSTGKIESKLDDINRGINGIVIPENHFDYDLIRNIFEHRVKKGNRTTIKHSKLF